jgi:hypothetical protein
MRSLVVAFALVLSSVPAFADVVTIHLGDITGNIGTELSALGDTPLSGQQLALTITWTAANFHTGYTFAGTDLRFEHGNLFDVLAGSGPVYRSEIIEEKLFAIS